MTTRPSASTDEGAENARLVPMRLQKFLARAGVASRRGSEDLMTAGRVRVNGEIVTALGAKVDPRTDEVAVDGRIVRMSEGPAYLVLNKPAGYVTTMRDTHGRPTVAELMPKEPAGLFPVGRLDRDTEGLLLLTTDGDLAQRLMHPRFHVPKTYLATVEGVPDDSDLARLREGVDLDDGPTAPAEAELHSRGEGRCVVRLTIREGRKRQVRRMLSAVGHPVVALERVAFGPIGIQDLPRGSVRPLTTNEVRELKEEAQGVQDSSEQV